LFLKKKKSGFFISTGRGEKKKVPTATGKTDGIHMKSLLRKEKRRESFHFWRRKKRGKDIELSFISSRSRLKNRMRKRNPSSTGRERGEEGSARRERALTSKKGK